jgi:hypothetical protein
MKEPCIESRFGMVTEFLIDRGTNRMRAAFHRYIVINLSPKLTSLLESWYPSRGMKKIFV